MELIEEKVVESVFAIKPENLPEQQSILTTEQISTTDQAFTTNQVNTTTDQADMKTDQDNMPTDQVNMNSVQSQEQNSYQQTQEDNSIKPDISEGISMDMIQEPSHQEGISMEMVEPAPETIDPILLKEQLKWFSATMRSLKKKADARFFLVPVDPVALAIPTYFTIVKEPMDISTIEQKISHGRYQKVYLLI
jgi:Bromodomain